MIYLVNKDTLNIKASVNGIPDDLDLGRHNLIAVESRHNYNPLRVKATKQNNNIVIEPKPFIDLLISNEDLLIDVDITIKEPSNITKTDANDELTLSISKVNSDKIIEKDNIQLNEGSGHKQYELSSNGVYIINAKHDEYAKADTTVTIEDGEVT